MKITLGTGDDAIVLCAGGADSVDGFSLNGQQQVQWLDAVRAASSIPANRGNQRTTLSFRIERQHADLPTAEAFVLQHWAALTGLQATCILTSDETEPVTVMYLPDCVVESVQGSYEGISSIFTYRLVGGALTETNPDA